MALGQTQIPGMDFTDDFSGVVHDVTLRMALTVWLVLGLDVDQMDVETAFLEGDLKEDECAHMICPEGWIWKRMSAWKLGKGCMD